MSQAVSSRWTRRARGWLYSLLVGLAAADPVAAQSLANGTLLVASPDIRDSGFARTVVLVLRHDSENGTVGLIVNRPTNLEPAAVFPELAERLGEYSGHLFRGGPIASTRVLSLVRGLAAATVQGPEVLDKVFLSIDEEALGEITRLADGTDDLRLFAGHAAWVPGQLEAEIRAGGWKVVAGDADLVFSADPGKLWAELDRRAPSGAEVVASVASPASAELATLRR
jgi:putative transcriptional regulator